MHIVSYESLKAEQAWRVVSDQLNQRNTLLAKGITHLEHQPITLSVASRLMILRYHLRHSLRQLTAEARQQPANRNAACNLKKQWMHIHQLCFLLRQVDIELAVASTDSDTFRHWVGSVQQRVYKSALVYLN